MSNSDIPTGALHNKLTTVADIVRGKYDDDPVGEEEWMAEHGGVLEAIETLSEELEAERERNDRQEERIATLEDIVHNDSIDAKVANIVQNARNRADTKQRGVVMGYKDIMAATGVSSTMAYNYIDELPEDYPFLHDRDDLPTHVEEDSLAKDRGLVVDLTQVEQGTGVFNRLLNDQDGNGGSA